MKRFLMIMMMAALLAAGCGKEDTGTQESERQERITQDAGERQEGDKEKARKECTPGAARMQETSREAGDIVEQAMQKTDAQPEDVQAETVQTVQETPEPEPDKADGGAEAAKAQADAPEREARQAEAQAEPGTQEAQGVQEEYAAQAEPEAQGAYEAGYAAQAEPEAPAQPQQPAPTAYDPQMVAAMAETKAKAGGKKILRDELDRMLAEGTVKQDMYASCYPYDGTGYYSVFVETDLAQTQTMSGRRLGSEDAVAQYIADTLLLEHAEAVGVEYAGARMMNGGQEFYEFRCHR